MHEFINMVEAYKVGERKLDARVALLCTTVANANRTRKDKLLKVSDFMPKYDDKKEGVEQTSEQMMQMAKLWTSLKGGKFIKKGGGDN